MAWKDLYNEHGMDVEQDYERSVRGKIKTSVARCGGRPAGSV